MFQRPVSGPGLVRNNSNSGTNVMAPSCNGSMFDTQVKAPEAKRVKLFNFLARKRIIQRLFILIMLFWISCFIYQAGVIEIILKSAQHDPFLGPHVQLPEDQQLQNNETKDKKSSSDDQNVRIGNEREGETNEGDKLKDDVLLFSKLRNITFLQFSSKNLSAMIHSKTSHQTGRCCYKC